MGKPRLRDGEAKAPLPPESGFLSGSPSAASFGPPTKYWPKLPPARPLLPDIAPATEPQPEGSHRRGGSCGQQLTAR